MISGESERVLPCVSVGACGSVSAIAEAERSRDRFTLLACCDGWVYSAVLGVSLAAGRKGAGA